MLTIDCIKQLHAHLKTLNRELEETSSRERRKELQKEIDTIRAEVKVLLENNYVE